MSLEDQLVALVFESVTLAFQGNVTEVFELRC